MQIELTEDEVKYVRAALTLVIFEKEELIETGKLAKELGDDAVLEPVRDATEYEERLRSILTKLPSA